MKQLKGVASLLGVMWNRSGGDGMALSLPLGFQSRRPLFGVRIKFNEANHERALSPCTVNLVEGSPLMQSVDYGQKRQSCHGGKNKYQGLQSM